MTGEISIYERKRKINIEENHNILKELCSDIPQELNLTLSLSKPVNIKKARLYSKPTPVSKPPVRASRRIKGEAAEVINELDYVVDQNDRIRQLDIKVNQPERLMIPYDISLPVTLGSIGTTIWSLGKLNTGKGRSKCWSSRSCKYRHPYPIGYRATKSHFGNDYSMTISADSKGVPVFTVQMKSQVFSGGTPTAPWTEACIKSKFSTTRVSGPLFYGFSDPITIQLIEGMEGYDKMSFPEDKEE
ncbi:hypothetical protein BDB01DRAFT_854374 [Pilobolus umbonatus]|nr:hypothetical protein BDB01DRAFT_854374 [Pilobolus umbonatus]